MGLFRDSLTDTTAALLAQHQKECGERYKETARQLERLSDKIDGQSRATNARFWAMAAMVLSALGYIVFSLLHAKGIW